MPKHTITKEMPLLEYLLLSFPVYNKTKIKQFLKHGSVAVNGLVQTAYNHKLKPGDKVELISRQAALLNKLKKDLGFRIYHEDDWLIVVDKPSGLLTMGSEKEKVNTLYFELTDYIKNQNKKGHGRLFIVHRLDREASGLIVFAKRETTKKALQENWPDVVKKYYAVTEGTPFKKSDVIESYLVEDGFRRVFSAGRDTPDAKRSSTRYQVIKSNNHYSLMDVTLITGRKNQIRVHLADLGHPIVGDEKYGASSNDAGRLALHAYLLAFKHPETGELLSFTSPPPDSFYRLTNDSQAL